MAAKEEMFTFADKSNIAATGWQWGLIVHYLQSFVELLFQNQKAVDIGKSENKSTNY